jgi:ubiquinone/menaquinone biosynthesis C-methylase UbiE
VDVETFPFGNNEFDVVISSFVIEHLKNPQNLFSEAFRALKSGGYFYCVTEYYTSVFALMAIIFILTQLILDLGLKKFIYFSGNEWI